MDGGAWWAAVHGVAKSWTRLSDFTFTFHFHALEEEMETHSSVLAWRIPGTAEPGGLPSMGSHSVGHDWSDLAAAAAVRLQHTRLPIIASEWGLAILGCPRDSGFYSCENISSRFLSICYPFCIIEVGPRSLSIEIGWKKISFICLFELDILLSNWSFFPPFFLLDTDE